ncbi:hypothetical protein HQN89_21890 [Paenibacillus frigoriresistens]|nr:hypothetical protein [Paenibacillus frigoriresistens]
MGQVCFSTKQAFYVDKAYDRENLAVLISGKVDYWNPNEECEEADIKQYKESTFFGYNPELEDQRMNFLYFELRPPLIIDIQEKEQTVAIGKLFIHFHPSGYVGLHLAVSFKDNLLKNSENILQLIKETRPGRKGNKWTWKSKLGVWTLQELVKIVCKEVSNSMYEDGTVLHVDDRAWSSSVSVVSSEDIEDIKEEMFLDTPVVLKMNSTIGVDVVKEQMLASRQGHLFHYNPLRNRQSVLHSFWRLVHIHEFVLLKNRIYEDYYKKIRQNSSRLTEVNLRKKEQLVHLASAYDPKIKSFLMELDRIIQGAEPFYRAAYSILGKGLRLDERRDKLTAALKEWEEELHRANEIERFEKLSQFRMVIEGDIYINHGQVAAMGRHSVSIGNEFTLSSGPCKAEEWKSEYLSLLQEVIKVLDGRSKSIYANWPDVVERFRSIVQAGEQGNEDALKQAVGDWRDWVQDIYKDERRNYADCIDSITKSSGLKKLLNLHKKVKF